LQLIALQWNPSTNTTLGAKPKWPLQGYCVDGFMVKVWRSLGLKFEGFIEVWRGSWLVSEGVYD